MNKKKIVLFVSLGLTFAISVGAVITIDLMATAEQKSTGKTPYQLYCESHPDYKGSEDQWLDDLVNGRLGDKDKYTVEFNTNGGSTIPNQTVTEGEKIVKPADPTKLGYTFKEWDYKGSPWIFYGYSVTENMRLDAVWTLDTYSIEYELNGGIIDSHANPTSYNVHSDIDLAFPTKDGYSCSGWFSGETKIEKIKPNMTGDLVLSARWSPNENILNVSVQEDQEDRGTVVVNQGAGKSGETIDIEASPISPYEFKGWFNDGHELVSEESHYVFEMPTHDLSLYAEFDELRELSLTVDQTKGTVSGAGDYVIGQNVIVTCIYNEQYVFKGWYSGTELVSKSSTYSFVMPEADYSLEAVFMTDEEIAEEQWKKDHGVLPVVDLENKTVTYGMYPQSHVYDSELIADLNSDAVLDEETGYYMYEDNFYFKIVAIPTNPGIGVDGKPNKILFDDGESIVWGEEYWFEVKPVVWNILATEDNNYVLMSRYLLDVYCFNSSYEERVDEHGNPIYANNYKESEIREWLTGAFYHSVFSLNDEGISSCLVDNSAESTGVEPNTYACEDTADKIYLPSFSDYLNSNYGFATHSSSTPDRTAKTTDFVRAIGAWLSFRENYKFNSYSWLRSPSELSYMFACKLSYGGGICRDGDIAEANSACVRPMIKLELED